jgi:hypothetical protein
MQAADPNVHAVMNDVIVARVQTYIRAARQVEGAWLLKAKSDFHVKPSRCTAARHCTHVTAARLATYSLYMVLSIACVHNT